ncbi:MAG: PAS domain S-box protein [Geobacteraceae bacterium]|nr:PAS domain S-box protein [Geobacteraceae bacterium]
MKTVYGLFIAVLLLQFVTFPAAAESREPQTRTIRVGAFNYYPAIFKDSDDIVKGFYVDALADLAQRENISFEYVYGSWNEGLERIKAGEVDVLTSVAYTPERAQFLDYSRTPLLTVWGELYAPLASEIDGIREIQGKKVAVMKSDFNGRDFIELVKKFGITCEFVEKQGFDDVFRAVASHEVDAGVVSSTFGVAKQKEFGLRSTGVVFNPFDIFFAVAKGKNQSLLALLENNLADWRHQADSPYNKARQKWAHGTTGTLNVIPHWLISFAAALGLLVVVCAIFIVLLRRQVQRATTDILRSKAVLMESEARFRSYIDNSPDGVFVTNENGRYLEVNPAASAITGYPEEELLRIDIPHLFPEESAQKVLDHFSTLKQTGRSSGEMEFLHKNGERRWWSVDAVKLSDTRYLGFTKDITVRKQSERELKNKNSEIEQFMYSISHDLRSPLVTIKCFMGYLEKDLAEDNREQIAQDIGYIHGAADKMKLLLDDLLEFSRIGRIESTPVEISLGEVLEEALDTLAGVIKERAVDIRVPDTKVVLFGDRRNLCRLWQNLIENAIKYSSTSSPLVEIGVTEVNGENVFHVRDNGIGIDPRYHSRIFGIFEKMNPKSSGAGLGLSMVQRIVHMYGGRVWVESQGVGPGSCFYFTLPGMLVKSAG